jgi:hypothetical protein
LSPAGSSQGQPAFFLRLVIHSQKLTIALKNEKIRLYRISNSLEVKFDLASIKRTGACGHSRRPGCEVSHFKLSKPYGGVPSPLNRRPGGSSHNNSHYPPLGLKRIFVNLLEDLLAKRVGSSH